MGRAGFSRELPGTAGDAPGTEGTQPGSVGNLGPEAVASNDGMASRCADGKLAS
eukprot:CAMPEP_0179869828 /NCGR_PEP_ID=MMETSP0982-20121206/19803_1 /TAXON_ID=483367 /ORGANISM="non described non described, Strain CCMP 2436" /LENGTH=53 /DNA_ID=CAMNT_0021760063 /DNA_START=1 /DNA_END=162 /DNA_ORIENTATION=+